MKTIEKRILKYSPNLFILFLIVYKQDKTHIKSYIDYI